MISFEFNGVPISAADFPRTLQGWVAFSIAFANNTHCRDKEAAVEMLMHDADRIIKQSLLGVPPE